MPGHGAAAGRRHPNEGRVARVSLFWLIVLGLTYAPSSHILLPLSFVVAERLLYLPSAAAACLAAGILCATAPFERPPSAPAATIAKWRHRRRASRVALCALLAAAGARTMRRNLDWRDDTSLFTSAAAAYPGSAKAHYQLADGLARRGQTAEASELLRRVLAIEPDYHYAHLHLSRM